MNKKKRIITLTGGMGTGKSTVSQMFRDLGITVIDADQIARDIVKPDSQLLYQITEKFGQTILNTDQTLNRSKLKATIFEDVSAKQWLEDLLHPVIYTLLFERAAKADSPYVILDIPLLVETFEKYNLNKHIDRILVVDATIEQQIERIVKRDGCQKDVAVKMIMQQINCQSRLDIADDVIENKGTLGRLKEVVKKIHLCYRH